jgi:hypothetical protein
MLITSCSNKDVIKYNYTYKGENEFWTAEYRVNGIKIFTEKNGTLEYDNSGNNELTVTYKNELSQLNSVRHLEISYKSSCSAATSSMNYTRGSSKKKTYTLRSNNNGSAIENEDDIIQVLINLDGKLQTFELKSEK